MSIKINRLASDQRVDIKIEDDLKHARVAYLVDREDFLVEVKKIRESLSIIELIPYEQTKKWLNKDRVEGGLSTMSKKGKDSFNRRWMFDSAVSKLKNKYHKGFHFTEVIAHAIIYQS